jgi:iron(III) transport system substrate-binding protein
LLPAFFFAVVLAGCGNESGGSSTGTEEPAAGIVVYAPDSGRSLDAILREFESATGIRYSIVPDDVSDPMSQADVYFAETFPDLWETAEADQLRPVDASLNGLVAVSQLVDPERRFVPLTAAPRAVVFNESLVSGDEVRTIANLGALANERWKGRLCLSSSRLDGNRLLVAHLVNLSNRREAEVIVRRWLQNLAAAEFVNDEALFAAIAAADCGLGILDLRLIGAAEKPAGIGFHTFSDSTPRLVDIAGAGITRHAQSPVEAAALLEWLFTAEGSSAFAGAWPDMPLSREAFNSQIETSTGVAIAMAAKLPELGFLLEEADLLIERAGYR